MMTYQMRAVLLLFTLSMFIGLWGVNQTTRAHEAASQPNAPSATFTVNSTDDVTDGFCNSAHCSFREAINISNNTAGTDTILFDFPSFAAILPDSELPTITDPVIIDAVAFSTANCASNLTDSDLEITLSGFNAGTASGLRLGPGSSGSTIKGLSIILFEEFGVVVEEGSNNNIIRCNHIGIDASGNVGLGNGLSGVFIDGNDNTVGGDSIDDRNVIADNEQAGILLGLNSDFNVVAGNYIGTEADGVTPQGNGFRGVGIYGDDNTIGGFDANERNVIADNGRDGIWISDEGALPTDNTIINNYIGVDKNGDPMGNTRNGVWIRSGSGATVGNSSAPNLIAHNGWNGIRVGEDAVENALRVNTIRDNGLLGIDLQGPGEANGEVTFNDFLDSDSGANELQNFPVLSSADVTGRVQGTVAGPPGDEVSLFFYINDSCDDSGFGEGKTFRQAVEVTIDSGGVHFLDVILNAPLTAGKYVVATSLDIDTENTSEFSNCMQVSEATFVVDSVGNTADANHGDGLCDITGASTDCTLRAAINEIEGSASNGPFRIEFDIPGAGPHVIAPPNDLDDITKPVTIDGTSQAGATCPVGSTPANLLIVLDGSAISSGNGLTLAAGSDSSEIRGLVIGGFPEQGIQVSSDSNTIACNHIGIDAAGTADFGNLLNGIRVSGVSNRIGGLSSGERNVISGNDVNGILLNTGAAENKVQGNFIGLNAAGDGALGNTEAGVRLNTATGNRIGGSVTTARNVISGNGLYGVHLRAESNDNEVWNNRIGTDRTGVTAVPNETGMYVRNSNNNQIGGDELDKGNLIAGNTLAGLHIYDNAADNLVQYNTIGLNKDGDPLGNGDQGIFLEDNISATQIEDNTIAHNGAAGISIAPTSTGNSIRENSIYENGNLGIDLNGNGVTANDGLGDPDTGANNLQNFPLLRSANPATTEISGTMEGAAATLYQIDIYRSVSCDPSDHGEGQDYLGTTPVTTDATGTQTFTVALSGFNLGEYITATATDPNGNTSEFSQCAQAGGSPPSIYLPLIVK